MPAASRLGFKNDPVYLVDGTAYLYRSFYAHQSMSRSDGFPTNAVYTLMRMFLKILREEKPKYLAFFLDGRGPTFRNEIFEPYKAQREAKRWAARNNKVLRGLLTRIMTAPDSKVKFIGFWLYDQQNAGGKTEPWSGLKHMDKFAWSMAWKAYKLRKSRLQ